MSKRAIRTLVAANLVLIALSVVVGFVCESSLPQPLQDYLRQEAEAEFTPALALLTVLGLLLLTIYLISSLGLMLFWSRSRHLFLASNFGFLVLALFLGPYVSTALESTLGDISAIVTGAVLAIVFLSPGREHFERSIDAA